MVLVVLAAMVVQVQLETVLVETMVVILVSGRCIFLVVVLVLQVQLVIPMGLQAISLEIVVMPTVLVP